MRAKKPLHFLCSFVFQLWKNDKYVKKLTLQKKKKEKERKLQWILYLFCQETKLTENNQLINLDVIL